jgi:hypothetical protein
MFYKVIFQNNHPFKVDVPTILENGFGACYNIYTAIAFGGYRFGEVAVIFRERTPLPFMF